MVSGFENIVETTIPSAYFGVLAHDRSAEIHLPLGLPGFERETSLIAVEIPDQRPLIYLHSTSNPSLCFLSLPTSAIASDLNIDLSEEERASLLFSMDEQLVQGENVMSLAILIPANGTVRVNLCAPLVINLRKMIGIQCLPASEDRNRRLELCDSGLWEEAC